MVLASDNQRSPPGDRESFMKSSSKCCVSIILQDWIKSNPCEKKASGIREAPESHEAGQPCIFGFSQTLFEIAVGQYR